MHKPEVDDEIKALFSRVQRAIGNNDATFELRFHEAFQSLEHDFAGTPFEKIPLHQRWQLCVDPGMLDDLRKIGMIEGDPHILHALVYDNEPSYFRNSVAAWKDMFSRSGKKLSFTDLSRTNYLVNGKWSFNPEGSPGFGLRKFSTTPEGIQEAKEFAKSLEPESASQKGFFGKLFFIKSSQHKRWHY